MVAMPHRSSDGAIGFDLYSAENKIVPKGKRLLVSTAIKVAIPKGDYLRIAPRSGLSLKGIDIGAGVVDPDYTGELKVLMINNSESDFIISEGDRIAQAIFEKADLPQLKQVEFLDLKTDRGPKCHRKFDFPAYLSEIG